MEHQAGTGWTGPAGEHGRERAAGPADDTGSAGAVAGAADDTGGAGAGQGSASPGAAPAAPEAPAAPGSPATGEPRVDAALKLLDRLPGMPVSDHPELFQQIHAQLSEVLGDLDSGPGATGPAGG